MALKLDHKVGEVPTSEAITCAMVSAHQTSGIRDDVALMLTIHLGSL